MRYTNAVHPLKTVLYDRKLLNFKGVINARKCTYSDRSLRVPLIGVEAQGSAAALSSFSFITLISVLLQ
jgi:hypothetical protein